MGGSKVVRLADVATLAGGTAFPNREQGRTDGEFPFFKVSDMNTEGNERAMTVCANWIDDAARKRLGARVWPEGTVIFPKVGAALKTEKRRYLSRPSAF